MTVILLDNNNNIRMTTVIVLLVEDINTEFKLPAFKKIDNKPSYTIIARLKTKEICNNTTVKCHVFPPHKNLCGAIKQSNNSLLFIGTAFVLCLYSSNTPKFLKQCGIVERKEFQSYYDMSMRLFLTLHFFELVLHL